MENPSGPPADDSKEKVEPPSSGSANVPSSPPPYPPPYASSQQPYASSSFQPPHSPQPYASSSFHHPPRYDPPQFQQEAKCPVPSGYDPSHFQHNVAYPIPAGYGPPPPQYPMPLGYNPSQHPYPQPYNDYYYQQSFKPVVPENKDASFGKAMLILMIVLVGGMCMMSLVMWFLFGTNIPEFEVTSLKVSNLNAGDTNLTGVWDVDFSVDNTNKEFGIHFDKITSSIFYKETLLGVSSLQPFQVEKTQKSNINFSLSALNDAKIHSVVLPQLAEDQSKGTVLFSLILSMKANFTTPSMVYRQDNLRVLCENMPVTFLNGEGRLIEGWRSSCLIHMHERVKVQ
ncbi:hypothetical protein Salat_2584600 [Sesamum alatum]|uniref:Late embryogenesis abundant protein LEA-2 subgroup domain-containing protein n=1 Tax=Sesamum alatum TaxID=300844 RepID=A0AAE1XNR5_9LAMI|nr:hypothetical protein Salat_2584600 [Sesamum alatum]